MDVVRESLELSPEDRQTLRDLFNHKGWDFILKFIADLKAENIDALMSETNYDDILRRQGSNRTLESLEQCEHVLLEADRRDENKSGVFSRRS